MKGKECRYFAAHMFAQAQLINKGMQICANYMAGFCPYGPECKQKHLKSVVIDE